MRKLLLVGRLVLAVALTGAVARANIAKVSNLSTAGSSVIVIPGTYAKLIIIQNNGSNDVRLSFDGGAGYNDPTSNKYGTNPTPTTGYLLKAGTQVVINSTNGSTPADSSLHRPIVAIMVSSTTTLDVITDDTASVFPTT